MKIKSASALVMCVLFTLLSGGCSIADFSADSLLKPPKAIGDEAEIEQLISQTADGGYTLKYPKNGNHRSAIIMTDLSGDENDEAIAFFREGDDTTRIHMLVMYSDGDSWRLSSDSVTEAADIDSVDFADVDGNGTLEILAGFTTYTPNINRLSCYSYKDGKTTEIKSGHNYSSFCSGDFDSDGNGEVMTLLLYTAENEALAAMLDYSKDNQSLYAKAMVNMDPNSTKFKSIAVSNAGDGTKGIVVDSSYANEELNTQIIYYNTELSLLRNPLFKEKTKNITRRPGYIPSCDIDDDGVIEIPIASKLVCPKGERLDSIADKIVWNKFSEKSESLSVSLSVVANYGFGYYFKISEKWSDDGFTAVVDSNNGILKFYACTPSELESELFEIRAFPLEDYNSGKNTDEYKLIIKDDRYAYAFKNTNAGLPVSLSDDEIKTSFMLINTTA